MRLMERTAATSEKHCLGSSWESLPLPLSDQEEGTATRHHNQHEGTLNRQEQCGSVLSNWLELLKWCVCVCVCNILSGTCLLHFSRIKPPNSWLILLELSIICFLGHSLPLRSVLFQSGLSPSLRSDPCLLQDIIPC